MIKKIKKKLNITQLIILFSLTLAATIFIVNSSLKPNNITENKKINRSKKIKKLKKKLNSNKNIKKLDSLDIISSFTTTLENNSNALILNSNENAKIAAKAVDEIVIKPGSVFSFKNTAGKAKGYLPSISFAQGKKITSVGGGMCRIATSLFNAALKANMKIIERKSHSRQVPYAKAGYDAAYAKLCTDFKFINTRKNPIKIKSVITDSTITIYILGKKLKEENFDVKLKTKEIKRTKKKLTVELNAKVYLNKKLIKVNKYYSKYYL